MKAWIVSDRSDTWAGLFHAETEGKAKLKGLEEYCLDDYTEMRAKRIPGLDNKPITYQNSKDAGFQYWDDETGDYLIPELFHNECRCSICREEEELHES
jgi:hypothetical protein